MADISVENLRVFVLVLLGLASIVVAIDKGIDAFNHLRKKKERVEREKVILDRIGGLEERMDNCEERLRRGDEKFRATSSDLTMMLEILNAVLMHMYSGNDHEELRKTIEKLSSYMSKRG